MYTDEFLNCPHCHKPRMIPPNGEDSPELLGPKPCGECRRAFIKETADTLISDLTSRLESGDRCRCSIGEPARDGLATEILIRMNLHVESLCHHKGRIGECSFDFESEQLRVSSVMRQEAEWVEVEPCQFSLNDIRLNQIIRNFVRALSLVSNCDDKDVVAEVRFQRQLADIRLAFQQPCAHVPRCSGL